MPDKEDELEAIFKNYERLLLTAANSEGRTAKSIRASFFKAIDDAMGTVQPEIKEYVDSAIATTTFSKDAASLLKSYGALYDAANVKLTTYVQIVATLSKSAEQLKSRVNGYISRIEKRGQTATVAKLQEFITKEIENGTADSITYSNGARMPAAKYAAMLSRTTRVETQNVAMLGQALDEGYDLVEIPSIPTTCPLCAMYQNRIYSISGKTPGYPKLYETAFKNGYSTIHPNCRHPLYIYKPSFHSDAENKGLEAGTKRAWTVADKKNINQSQAARDEYARGQQLMRQWNKELNAFGEMTEAYREAGKEPPYKTIGAFRRAYRSEEGSTGYTKSHYWRNDI